MLGLPSTTEVHRIITKKKIIERFGAEMSAERRKRFDSEIARITLVNEVSPVSVNIPAGEEVRAFFVLLIQLKKRDFDQQNIGYIAKLFGQKLLMVLEAEGQQRLALWQTRLIMNGWTQPNNLYLSLTGINLDQTWAYIVSNTAGVQVDLQNKLDDQLIKADQLEKKKKEIIKLEKLARAEKQPKRKFELMQQIRKLTTEIEG